ncbi:MAG: hypothetical protein LPK45_08650 [Bacteroidota bacterium]|nr:hypothetical protein [Bacteroidota bacterium]MDX5431145.1 hypothetical protein [Bacteroidota bacterium]MDX5469892.1 hypothetical protein [Bacteroidota bacterium]
MKNTKKLLFGVLAATFILTSCSQQRYASRAKVRVNDQARVEVKKHDVLELTQVEKLEAELPVITPSAPELEPMETAARVERKQVFQQLKSKETRTALKNMVSNPENIIPLINKEDSVQKEKFAQDTGLDMGNKWVKLMVIGLILMVIGTILGWGPGWGLGWLLNTIGGVMFVIGLVMFLIEM